jgi:hypothetical protein
MLESEVCTEFFGTALPGGWLSAAFASGGTATVADGALVLDGARAGSEALYGPGHSLEAMATFEAARFQHLGFGTTYMVVDGPWAIISTGPDGDGLYARTYVGTGTWDTQSTPIPGSYFGEPHRYRVDWGESSITYYVDGVQVASHDVAIATPMRPLPADSDVGGATLSVDWLRMSPYAASGTFLSRIFDAGQGVAWQDLTWFGDAPDGTSATFETRTGDTPAPDASWSDWAPVGSPIASPDARYLQYRAGLATSDAGLSPAVEMVVLTIDANPTAVSLASFSATPAAGGVTLAWETISELDTLGFSLYRSPALDGPRLRLNDGLIPTQAFPGSPAGSTYTWTDDTARPGLTYYYWLEDVDVYGLRTLHGPAVATLADEAPYRLYLPLVNR